VRVWCVCVCVHSAMSLPQIIMHHLTRTAMPASRKHLADAMNVSIQSFNLLLHVLHAPQPAHAMSSAVAVLLAGWGTKEGSLVKSWKRRFFVLRDATEAETAAHGCTHMLVYFKTQKQVIAG
jgi:hypothetical protein